MAGSVEPRCEEPALDAGFLYPGVRRLLGTVAGWLPARRLLPGSNRAIDYYVLARLVALLALGLLTALHSRAVDTIAAAVSAYAMIEIALNDLHILLHGYWRADEPVVSVERSVVLFVMDYVDLVLAFATLCLLLDRYVRGAFTGSFANFADAFYYAAATLTTTGYGDIAPLAWPVRLFVALCLLVCVVLLLQILARAVALTKPYVKET